MSKSKEQHFEKMRQPAGSAAKSLSGSSLVGKSVGTKV